MCSFSDKLWQGVKLRSEYGSVMKEVSEAKRKKEEELLKLPVNSTNVIGGSGESSSRTLAITAGATETIKLVFFRIKKQFSFNMGKSLVHFHAAGIFSVKKKILIQSVPVVQKAIKCVQCYLLELQLW